MNRIITIPRAPYFFFVVFGLLGIFITGIQNPDFYSEPSFSNIDQNLYIALLICIPIITWGTLRTFHPPILFKYSDLGISFPGSHGIILWHNVIAAEETEMKVGTEEIGSAEGSNIQPSIKILLSEKINLIVPKLKSTHGRLIDAQTYIFTTGVVRESTEKILNEINSHIELKS